MFESAAVTVFVVLACVGQAVAGAGRVAPAPHRVMALRYDGNVNLRALAAREAPAALTAPGTEHYRTPPTRPKQPPARAAVAVPNPSAARVVTNPRAAPGFVGLTAVANADVNQVDFEPPDQGLCAHGGAVLEAVNLVVGAYSLSGARLQAPASLNSFFGLAPAVSSHFPPTYGPALSDPRCYYDSATDRWFLSALEIDVNPFTGDVGYRSSVLIAVSQSGDPTGDYALFSIDTTNDGVDGTQAQPNCPCFGDQPRIGADANGFYISDDSYPIHGNLNSDGGELYALSKSGLTGAASGINAVPSVVAIDLGAVTFAGYPANAVQPAQTPPGAAYPRNREYFLSTPDFDGLASAAPTGARSIVFWTLLNTASLGSASPALTLAEAPVASEAYVAPVDAVQRPGPRPLGTSLAEPESRLASDDDRMQQVQYLAGQLVSALSTGIGYRGAHRSGVAVFDLATSGTSGKMLRQRYLAAGGDASLLYPSIAVTSSGKGAMTLAISGSGYYPSAAFVPFSLRDGIRGPITINGRGIAPDDGMTCYEQYGLGPPCRWGDYSAAASTGSQIVMGDEIIARTSRTRFANWSTLVSHYKP